MVFSHDGLQIRNSPFVDNKQFVLIAVQQDGIALKYVSSRLQADLDVVLRAVNQNGLAIAWAHWPAVTTNVAMAAIMQNSATVAFAKYIIAS